MSSPDAQNGILPFDLILQILARLPIKSLFRCRSVCKSWRRLPFDDYFVRLHFKASSDHPTVLIEILESAQLPSHFVCVDRFGDATRFSLDFLGDRVKVRASCNGLLCCASIPHRGIFYVCNPMTRQFCILPRTRERPFTRCQPEYEATLVGLAFNPSVPGFSVVLAGFYRPFGRLPHNQFVCMVYDSMTNAWSRFVSSHYDEFTHMNRNQVVFASGMLHWLTNSCSYVLALDLQNEIWRKIPLPDEIIATRTGARLYLLDLEGSVSVIQILGIWMCIWVLKDQSSEQWVLEDRVHLRCIRGFAGSVFPISQTQDVVFMATQKRMLTYGRKEKVWKEIYAVKDTFTFPLWFSAHAFRSTLFPCC